jgi:hypothetical protein
MVDVIGREEITQERLVSTNVNGRMPGGTMQSKERVQALIRTTQFDIRQNAMLSRPLWSDR